MSTIDTPARSATSVSGSGRHSAFVSTHWSLILKASGSDTSGARDALASLCSAYWYPLYVHARRRGYSAHDAQDLTQGFFAHLLERHTLTVATPERGRFRSFLLTSMNNFLSTEWQKTQTKKRGGDYLMVSLDLAAAEERYDLEPADDCTPDKAFDKTWALQLLATVLKRLEDEYAREGKGQLFSVLKQTLTGSREAQAYAALAQVLNLNEGAVKVAVHRLRKRYRALIREEISHTVAFPDEVDSEMRLLLQALAGN